MTIVFDDLEAPGGGIIFGDLDSIGELPEPWVLVVTPEYVVGQPADDIPFQLAKHLDVAHVVVHPQNVDLGTTTVLTVDAVEVVAQPETSSFNLTFSITSGEVVTEGQNVGLVHDDNTSYSLVVDSAEEGVVEPQGGHTFPISMLLVRRSVVVSPKNIRLLWSERPAIPYSGRYITVAEVSPSGLSQWVHYLPVTRVLLDDEDKVNRFDDDGALAVRVLDSTSGLTPWVDYIPVVEVDRDAKGKWTYNDNGYIPICEVTDP